MQRKIAETTRHRSRQDGKVMKLVALDFFWENVLNEMAAPDQDKDLIE
jgi:hypothetical protein